jgi:hypothetical protein
MRQQTSAPIERGNAGQILTAAEYGKMREFGRLVDRTDILPPSVAEPGDADFTPPREIPALIQHLRAETQELEDEIMRLAERLKPVTAPRPVPGEKAGGLKVMTGVGSELAGVIAAIDGSVQRVRDLTAAIEI